MESIETIRNLILTNKKPSYRTTNNKEISVRCPYCGDSKKPMSAHLYIEMQPPFRYHCKKCETAGVLTNQTLRDLGIYDSSLIGYISEANKENRKFNGKQKLTCRKLTLKNSITNSSRSLNSVKYFNNRFNLNLDEKYIVEKFRVVTDPLNFFKENNILISHENFDFGKSIGFISSDNSHIIFRDISSQQKLRYFNLNIDDSNESASKIYNIKTEVDIMANSVNLILTEGIFDIIGVYEHFYKNIKDKNYIFAASCGKGFNAVILNYIRKGFLNLNIEIYSDGDVDADFYKRLKESSEYLKNMVITVYYNDLYDPKTGFGKDYGVPKSQIKLKKILI